jgi:hypothetical protein
MQLDAEISVVDRKMGRYENKVLHQEIDPFFLTGEQALLKKRLTE